MLRPHWSQYRHHENATMPLAAPRPSRSHLIPDVVYLLEKMADRVDDYQSSQLPSPPRSDALYLRTAAQQHQQQQQSVNQSADHRNSVWPPLSLHHVLEPDTGYFAESSSLPWPTNEETPSLPLFQFPPRLNVETFSLPHPVAEEEYEDEDAEGSVYDDTDLIGVNPEDVMDEDAEDDDEMQLFGGDIADRSSLSVYNPLEQPFDLLSYHQPHLPYQTDEAIDYNTRPTMESPSNSSARAHTSESGPVLLFSPLYDYCFSAPALSATSSSSSSSPASFAPHSTQPHLPDNPHLQDILKSDPTRSWQPNWDKPLWVSQSGSPPHSAIACGYNMY